MVDRTKAPVFKKIDSISLQNPEKHLFDNGAPLFVINAGSQPILRLEFIIRAGIWYESKPGLAYFTSKMLLEGTETKSAHEISYLFDRFGAHIEITPGFDFLTIAIYTLSKHLPALLPIIREILTEPTFPNPELETLKKIKIQNTRVNSEKTNYLASVNFRKKLFGDHHPYGKELTEEEIQDISLEDLQVFYQEYLFNEWEIILSGQVESIHIELIRNYFETHPRNSLELNSYLSSNENTCPSIIEKSSSLQSSIRIGKKLFTKDHPYFHKIQIVNEILGGYFGSRLMKNIREDKGFTYGIHSNVISLRKEGYLVIGTDVKKENTVQTIEEIYKEVRILSESPVEDLELETVKNFMTGSFLAEINTPFALADKFKSVHLHGLHVEIYQDYIQTINNIDSDSILEIANKYLSENEFVEVIAGGID
ncbi:pitrilysin family protein [soil metagenome]